MDQRYQALCRWLAKVLEVEQVELTSVSGDASFRRYFRLAHHGRSYIAMDAPPEKEDSHSFVAIANSWRAQGVAVPELIKVDLSLGFLLLGDFGDELLLPNLRPESPDIESGKTYYSQAMNTLAVIQALKPSEEYELPPYDSALLQREMSLFPDWLLEKKLGINLTDEERALLDQTFSALEQRALAQPQVVVHRDYHARNLMVVEGGLGVIDFQDAVLGPITYDLVSLLRDCYIVWPDDAVDAWCREYYALLETSGARQASYEQFKRDFDWMGMQRHLKASGIFARLSIRDGKHGYLEDIPRTVKYIHKVGSEYSEFAAFIKFLEERVLPRLAGSLEVA